MKGSRVVVTGAAGGIGSAVVDHLVAAGASVAALDVTAPRLPGVRTSAAVDVTEEEAIAAAVEDAEARLGGIDGLVAMAGIQAGGPTHELDAGTFRKVLEVSAVGTFLTAKAVLPTMLASGGGRIVTFGSTAAVCAAPELAAYAAAKGAVLQFTRSIAVEYAKQGVRANCVCPGGTATAMMRAIDGERTGPDEFLSRHPAGRYADPDEIASVVGFLLSDRSSFMLGSTVMVDGGFSAA